MVELIICFPLNLNGVERKIVLVGRNVLGNNFVSVFKEKTNKKKVLSFGLGVKLMIKM